MCPNLQYTPLAYISVKITEKMLCPLHNNTIRSTSHGKVGVYSALAADIPRLSRAFVIDCTTFAIVYPT